MYLKHFGLTGFPFDKAIPADELFVSAALRELAVRLNHLLELSGIGLLTGDAGSGKSCAARAMTPACTRASTKASTSPSPPVIPSTSTSPSPGNSACPSSAPAPPSTARSKPKSRGC